MIKAKIVINIFEVDKNEVMKKLLLLLLLIATIHCQAKLSAVFSQSKFYRGNGKYHIENYMLIDGSSLQQIINSNKNFQGKILIECTVKSGDSIFFYDKYNLLSPEASTIKDAASFVEQINFDLPKGNYSFLIVLKDANSNEQPLTIDQPFSLEYPVTQYQVSNIELAQQYANDNGQGKFSKNGITVMPYPDDYLPQNIDTLKFYAEIFNSIPNDSQLLVKYYLMSKGKYEVMDNLIGYKKITGKELNVIAASLPLTNIYSGNYVLVVELRSRSNELLSASNFYLMRGKKNLSAEQSLPEDFNDVELKGSWISYIDNLDSLKMYIQCTVPISGRLENIIADNQVTAADKVSMQKYILYFWKKRNPANPEAAWLEYKEKVDVVNVAYKVWNNPGYATDRGRVYLQYGPPNKMVRRGLDEPLSYPYEIWHYYQLADQGNKKFVFYTTEAASNDLRLLHSDARGEVNEPQWEVKLVNRTQQFGNDYDNTNSNDYGGKKTETDFKLPK